MTVRDNAVLAVAAHPDDIEFMMGGTLCLLREAGYRTHYLNVANGSCGSSTDSAAVIKARRAKEARKAAAVLGAHFHPSRVDDLEILYSVPLLRWLVGIVRKVRPSIVLTHSPQDYMEDHTNTCRLAVTAAFSRGMRNFARTAKPIWSGDVTVYHAQPHGLCDGLRRRMIPGSFVDITSVMDRKLKALACLESQAGWLRDSQGMDSYLTQMQLTDREMGRMSRRFRFAEGWRRHSHLGFSATDVDPMRTALGSKVRINAAYEAGLKRGTAVD
jgi:LmbE family N-acetylglucosaminyl deacetylase